METIGKKLLITDFGAVPSPADSTSAIRAAIDACGPNDAVVIPKGSFKCGAVRLKSNMTLFFEDGAVMLMSDDYKDYLTDGSWSWRCAGFTAQDCENITVAGQGVLDGQNCFCPLGEEGFRGPHMILMDRCRNVSFRGFTVRDSANYAILLTDCYDCVVDGISVIAGHDGVHTQRCKNFSIQNCDFRTGDDSIAGSDNSNFVIRQCYFNTACNALRFGGENVTVENCRFQGPGEFMHRLEGRLASLHAFINFAPADRSTSIPVRNWTVRNITADHMLSLYNLDSKREWQDGPMAQNILFEDVVCTNMQEAVKIDDGGCHCSAVTLRRCRLHLDPSVEPQPLIDAVSFDSLTLEDVTLDNDGRGVGISAKNGNLLRLSDLNGNTQYTVENITEVIK